MSDVNREVTMEKVVALSKNRGFVYPGSEIYGGLANTWDYGPLGAELKNNVKKAWWRKFVQESKYNVGLDAAILMNPQTWVASGHVGGFSDPLVDCKSCKSRFRADKLIEDFHAANGMPEIVVDGWSNEELEKYIAEHNIPCPECGKTDFTGIRQFNLMFKTFQGVTEDSKSELYLRPETAQGIFVNFKNVQRTSRKKVPFGIGQSENLSVTKSHRATLFSVCANLNRWNLNSSVNRERTSNGSITGGDSVISGCFPSESKKKTSDFVTIARKNFVSIRRQQQTSNSNSHSAGANFGALLTVRTMTLRSIRTHQDRI